MGPWTERLADLLAPRTCGACRRDLPASVQGPACGDCLRALPRFEGRSCRRCAQRLASPEDLCRACRGRVFAVDCIRAAFPYAGPVRGLLHAFKYRGRLEAGRLLAGWLGGLAAATAELRGAGAVVPVPLHPSRLRERGFNQAALLAGEAGRKLGAPILDGLARSRPTRARWRLTRAQRLRDLEGAFRWEGPPPPRRVLLIDDVCTSGGTLEACGRALQQAGAEEVLAYVLARD